MFRRGEAGKDCLDTQTLRQRPYFRQPGRRKLLGHVFIDRVHQHFERRVVPLWHVRAARVEQLDAAAVWVAEAKRSPRKQVLEQLRIFAESGRLMLREVLALSLVDEKRDELFGDHAQNFGDGIHESRLAAGDQDQPVVENEQARLGEQERVAALGFKHRNDPGACSADDALPDPVAQSAQGRKARGHDQLQLLFGAFEKTLGHHGTPHHAQMRHERNRERRILA